MRNLIYRDKVFIWFLVSYICILLIPIIFQSTNYFIMQDKIKEEIETNNMLMLEQIQNIMDQRLKEIDNLTIQIESNPKIKKLLSMKKPIEGNKIYSLVDAQKDLAYFNLSNNFIKSMYIYFHGLDCIVSPTKIAIRMPLFHMNYLNYANTGFEEWKMSITGNRYYKDYFPAIQLSTNNEVNNVITYLHTIPMSIPGKNAGTILVFIKEDKIHELLKQLEIYNGGLAVYDSEGQLITSIGLKNMDKSLKKVINSPNQNIKNVKVDDQSMIVYSCTSLYNNWSYVSVVPNELAMSKLVDIKNLTTLSVLLAILLGLITAYLLAYRNFKPLQELRQAVFKGAGSTTVNKNIYNDLRTSFNTLINDKNTLTKTISEQLPYVRESFIHSLLNGDFYNDEDMDASMKRARLSIRGKEFFVMIVQPYIEFNENDMSFFYNDIKKEIRDIMNDVMNSPLFFNDIDLHKMAILLCIDEKQSKEGYIRYIECGINRACSHINEKYNVKILFGAGRFYQQLTYVYRSNIEAKLALEYKQVMETQPNIIWYKKIKHRSQEYFYPLEIEYKLINAAAAGEPSFIEKELYMIFEENFKYRELNLSMTKHLIYAMRNTVIRLMTQMQISQIEEIGDVDTILDNIKSNKSFEATYHYISRVLVMLCNIGKERKRHQEHRLKGKMIEYVVEKYADPQLCLNEIADKFNITSSYVSQLFKRELRQNFASYLVSVRMNKATELLQKTDLTIEEISESVGYNSAHAFRRAFKRVYGITPTNFKLQ